MDVMDCGLLLDSKEIAANRIHLKVAMMPDKYNRFQDESYAA